MTKKQIEENGVHKPIIETIINTCALALTASGVVMVQARDYFGFLCIIVGAGLEFFKYWGRKKHYW